MEFNQKLETEDSVQKFYSLIYMKFNRIIKEYVDQSPQHNINEDLVGDDFISVFDKYFKYFIENGFFVEENNDPYLEFHTEEGKDFVIININIENVKGSFNNVIFSNCKKLAEEMGYDYKWYNSNNKTSPRGEFRVPYSDFERGILISAFEKLNRRANYLEKENYVLKKEKDGLEKEISPIKNEIKKLKDNKQKNEKIINDLKWEIKDSKYQNERLIEEISKIRSENIKYKLVIGDANKKLAENKKLINALVLKIKKDFNKRE